MKTRPYRLRPAFVLALVCVSALVSMPGVGRADAVSSIQSQLVDIEADTDNLARMELRRAKLRSDTHVEERLTDGELFYRLQDYVRASVIFTDIVENYAQHSAYPDALFLLGDSLFRWGDYLGARTRFRMVIDRAAEGNFRPYVQRSLGRLIEIAIHTRDFDGVDDYFQRLSQLPPTEVEAATAYFRAKYLYNIVVDENVADPKHKEPPAIDAAGLERARVAFEAVSPRSAYYMQARYFIGVIFTLRGQYPQAIEAFKRVVAAEVTTDEQRAVQDLGALSLGRVHYQMDQLEPAFEAYQRVPRGSTRFDVALYEIAWAYIRQGDSSRAERSLEMLSVATPASKYIPDARLLRGNLLLRDGRFKEALKAFGTVAKEFDPVRSQLEQLIKGHEDPVAHFQKLVRDNMEAFDVTSFLPPLALRWSEPRGDMDRAMTALSDFADAKRLVRETDDLVHRLNSALGAKNSVNIFRDLKTHRERTTGLRNKLAISRKALIKIEDKATKHLGSAELTAVRTRRRELESQLGGAPTDASDFQKRTRSADRSFRKLVKQLSTLQVQLMGMEAKVVATDRFISDSFKGDGQESGVAAYLQELEGQRAAIEEYRERIRRLKIDVEAGRLRVGVGDDAFEREKKLRDEYAGLIQQERSIIASLGGRGGSQTDELFRRVARVEDKLDAHDGRIDAVVAERTAEMRKVLDEESVNLDGYRARMTELQSTTEEVIGGIAYANFKHVHDRFYNLVMRADVGSIDVTWAQREEHRRRVEMLTRDRTRAIKALDAEFAEIMDAKDKK